MGNIERRSGFRVEVMDVAAVTNDAFSVGNVEIAGNFVHLHRSTDYAAFIRAKLSKMFRPIMDTLR